jgi:hypothetical protein
MMAQLGVPQTTAHVIESSRFFLEILRWVYNMGGIALKMPAIWPKMQVRCGEQVHTFDIIP